MKSLLFLFISSLCVWLPPPPALAHDWSQYEDLFTHANPLETATSGRLLVRFLDNTLGSSNPANMTSGMELIRQGIEQGHPGAIPVLLLSIASWERAFSEVEMFCRFGVPAVVAAGGESSQSAAVVGSLFIMLKSLGSPAVSLTRQAVIGLLPLVASQSTQKLTRLYVDHPDCRISLPPHPMQVIGLEFGLDAQQEVSDSRSFREVTRRTLEAETRLLPVSAISQGVLLLGFQHAYRAARVAQTGVQAASATGGPLTFLTLGALAVAGDHLSQSLLSGWRDSQLESHFRQNFTRSLPGLNGPDGTWEQGRDLSSAAKELSLFYAQLPLNSEREKLESAVRFDQTCQLANASSQNHQLIGDLGRVEIRFTHLRRAFIYSAHRDHRHPQSSEECHGRFEKRSLIGQALNADDPASLLRERHRALISSSTRNWNYTLLRRILVERLEPGAIRDILTADLSALTNESRSIIERGAVCRHAIESLFQAELLMASRPGISRIHQIELRALRQSLESLYWDVQDEERVCEPNSTIRG